MEIELNGEKKRFTDDTTASELINQLGLADKRLAMEVNEEILPRSQFNEYVLKKGDRVEIVHAIGGG